MLVQLTNQKSGSFFIPYKPPVTFYSCKMQQNLSWVE